MAVNGVIELPQSEHRISPPESAQNLWAAREDPRLPFPKANPCGFDVLPLHAGIRDRHRDPLLGASDPLCRALPVAPVPADEFNNGLDRLASPVEPPHAVALFGI